MHSMSNRYWIITYIHHDVENIDSECFPSQCPVPNSFLNFGENPTSWRGGGERFVYVHSIQCLAVSSTSERRKKIGGEGGGEKKRTRHQTSRLQFMTVRIIFPSLFLFKYSLRVISR